MNLIIYLVLTVVLLGTLGQKNPTTTVDSITQCVVAANSPDANSTTCPASAPKSPAYEAKLRPGDKIEAINGTHIGNWDQAVKVIEGSAGQHLTLTVRRAGQDVAVPITPVRNVKYANDQGTKTKDVGYLGVSAREAYQTVGAAQIPGQIVSQLAQGLHAIGNYPNKIGSLWGTVFEGKKRDPNGAIGVVGIGRLGGQVADSHQLDAMDKIFALTELLATVNLLLFFFNLLPLLPLDGGHVAGAIVEAAKRGRARLRARSQVGPDGSIARTKPKPIYVDTAQMLPVMYAVASVLVLVTLLVLYADIVKPVNA
jgi:membrane-associated protease RseP (regulator of RpoE activity)